MTQTDFISLVKRMREAQKIYFRLRTTEVLEPAKSLEKQVDNAIREMENNQIKMF